MNEGEGFRSEGEGWRVQPSGAKARCCVVCGVSDDAFGSCVGVTCHVSRASRMPPTRAFRVRVWVAVRGWVSRGLRACHEWGIT